MVIRYYYSQKINIKEIESNNDLVFINFEAKQTYNYYNHQIIYKKLLKSFFNNYFNGYQKLKNFVKRYFIKKWLNMLKLFSIKEKKQNI